MKKLYIFLLFLFLIFFLGKSFPSSFGFGKEDYASILFAVYLIICLILLIKNIGIIIKFITYSSQAIHILIQILCWSIVGISFIYDIRDYKFTLVMKNIMEKLNFNELNFLYFFVPVIFINIILLIIHFKRKI